MAVISNASPMYARAILSAMPSLIFICVFLFSPLMDIASHASILLSSAEGMICFKHTENQTIENKGWKLASAAQSRVVVSYSTVGLSCAPHLRFCKRIAIHIVTHKAIIECTNNDYHVCINLAGAKYDDFIGCLLLLSVKLLDLFVLLMVNKMPNPVHLHPAMCI